MTRFRILTVCTGNVHRSPLAAAMLDRWASWYLPASVAAEVSVSSAGTRAAVGVPMGTYPRAIAEALGGTGEGHRATQLTDEDIAQADLVLAASRTQRDIVLARVPSALRRTFTFREAGRTAELVEPVPAADVGDLRRTVALLTDRRRGATDPDDDDVIDPHGLGVDGYARMAAEQVPALAALAVTLFGMPRGDLEAYREAASDPALLTGRLSTPTPGVDE